MEKTHTHGGRTGGVYVNKEQSIEHKSVMLEHLPVTYKISPGETCLLSIRNPIPLRKTFGLEREKTTNRNGDNILVYIVSHTKPRLLV